MEGKIYLAPNPIIKSRTDIKTILSYVLSAIFFITGLILIAKILNTDVSLIILFPVMMLSIIFFSLSLLLSKKSVIKMFIFIKIIVFSIRTSKKMINDSDSDSPGSIESSRK